jgi:hypothetical protein
VLSLTEVCRPPPALQFASALSEAARKKIRPLNQGGLSLGRENDSPPVKDRSHL